MKGRLAALLSRIAAGLAVTSAAIVSLSADAATTASAKPSFSQRAEKVKNAIDQMLPADPGNSAPPVMQWGNWRNWNNWPNWGNWNNWNNWANWINW